MSWRINRWLLGWRDVPLRTERDGNRWGNAFPFLSPDRILRQSHTNQEVAHFLTQAFEIALSIPPSHPLILTHTLWFPLANRISHRRLCLIFLQNPDSDRDRKGDPEECLAALVSPIRGHWSWLIAISMSCPQPSWFKILILPPKRGSLPGEAYMNQACQDRVPIYLITIQNTTVKQARDLSVTQLVPRLSVDEKLERPHVQKIPWLARPPSSSRRSHNLRAYLSATY